MNYNLTEFSLEWLTIAADDLKWAKDTYCVKIDSEFSSLKDALTILDSYYIGTRYPDIGDIEQFETQELALEALTKAEEVLLFVKRKITI